MRTIPLYLIAIAFLLHSCATQYNNQTNPLDAILAEMHKEFPTVLSQPDKYEIQIRYTQVEELEKGKLQTKTYTYGEDITQYFYPASTVKMPVAILALEKLERLQSDGHDLAIDTPIRFESGPAPLTEHLADSTAQHQQVSIRHLINQIFSVSDNNAYNRLYEFLGRDFINQRLQKLGVFSNSRIVHRLGLAGFTYQENGLANPFEFYDEDKILYSEKLKRSNGDWLAKELKGTKKGIGYIHSDDSKINQAFDMSQKNFIRLDELEACLLRVTHPQLFNQTQQFNISEEHRLFLLHAMGRLPKEHLYPQYDTEEYYDAYGKFFMFGDKKDDIPEHIRIFNKVGYAYGTLTDAAYILDLKNNISFFLSATILVNENQIFNDGVYEYEEIGLPFLAKLGNEIYQHELKRQVKRPDLQALKLDFAAEY